MADEQLAEWARPAAAGGLAGVPILVSRALAGSKRAVRYGQGPIFVSPAMWDLMRAATPDELARVLAAIEVLQLPDYRVGRYGPFTGDLT